MTCECAIGMCTHRGDCRMWGKKTDELLRDNSVIGMSGSCMHGISLQLHCAACRAKAEALREVRPNAANPKQAMGDKKVKMALVPSSAIIAEAEAFDYGAFKAPRADGLFGYGPLNWRETKVEAMTYVHAALRHIYDWVDGEELAPDSLKKHLGHARASLGIIIDAMECGMLIDNRPKPGPAPRLLEPVKK